MKRGRSFLLPVFVVRGAMKPASRIIIKIFDPVHWLGKVPFARDIGRRHRSRYWATSKVKLTLA